MKADLRCTVMFTDAAEALLYVPGRICKYMKMCYNIMKDYLMLTEQFKKRRNQEYNKVNICIIYKKESLLTCI
jgi:hypothetical protein